MIHVITDDHILTKQRQLANKNGVPKGFPIWVLRNRYNSILGIFASKQNALKKKEELEHFMWLKLDLLFISDITQISYELEYL